jgi:sugar lactone lactonase YvrE
MATAEFTCVLDCRATLGECPVWSTEEQALYFVDIKAPALLRFDPESGDLRAMPMPEHIGSFALMRSGGFLAAMRSGIFRLDRDGNVVAKLADNPEAHTSRFNDGRCDPHGRFYVGTMDETRKGLSALYRFADGELVKIQGGVMTSNGLAFSPDGSFMYHSDSPRFTAYRYPYEALTGVLGERQTFATLDSASLDQGRPDGAAVDSEGSYWSALYSGARVRHYADDGRLLAEYPVPAKNATMVAFGGPDLRTLYVTTARDGMTPAELERWPLSGGVFSMRVEVPGLPEPVFAG